jgi:hypothetical protein
MNNNKRDLLEVLKDELEFTEKGGYRNPIRAPWRPQFMFQDSLSCLNFEVSQHPKPCSDCALMQLVPADSQQTKYPCRYIPLNEQGDTLDLLYRTGTQKEIETTFIGWLKPTITRLEQEKAESLRASAHPEVHVRARFVPYR